MRRSNIRRCLAQKVKSYSDKAALKVAGVQKTVTIETFKPPHLFKPLGGVAVIADNTWAAFEGRKASEDRVGQQSAFVVQLGRISQDTQSTSRQPGKVARNMGDVDAEFAKGGKIIEAEYDTPHLAHAAMEPNVAVAEYRDGKVQAWAPTQNPQEVQNTVASVLGIKKKM